MVNFQQQVIERSHQLPVLVDFWAPWCGPCRVLGPTLEQLAQEQKDRWELVKINTDEQPELAQEYDIMSIPNVKLFHHGQVVNEFVGALSKKQIENWLDEAIPGDHSSELQTILEGMKQYPDAATEEKLRQFLMQNPDNREAKIALARHLAFHDTAEALSLVADIHVAEPEHDQAEDVRAIARLISFAPANGEPVAGKLSEAAGALKNSDYETAIRRIIDATMIDKGYQDDLPRRAAVALFHFWGTDHELTRKYERRFHMALY